MLTEKAKPGEIITISDPKLGPPVLQSTVIDDLNLSIDDLTELVKNPTRSIVNAILNALENIEYGVTKEIRTRREINPLQLKVYFTMSKQLHIDPETEEITSYGIASIAMKTCFGPIAFTIDTTELEILKSNTSLIKTCEETVTGRAIIAYIYDELSNLNNNLSMDDETRNRILKYLHR